MRISRRILTFVCALVLSLLMGGVYAMWIYAGPANPVGAYADIMMFTPNYPEEGHSHKGLIDALLNGIDTNGNKIPDKNNKNKHAGMNNPDSFLNGVIEARQNGGDRSDFGGKINEGRNTVGSMAELFKDELARFGAGVQNLAFLIYFPDGYNANTMKIYTWSIVDGGLPRQINGNKVSKSDIAMGNWRTGNIFNYKYHPETEPTKTVWVHPIYETTIVKKNGVWEQEGSTIEGYAKAAFYTENRNNAVFSTMHGSELLSIYPPSFTTEYPV